MTRKTLGCGMALVALVVALGVFGLRPQTQAQQPAAPAAPAASGAKFIVVDSDATNLIVVDNSTNTLYFYAEDPGKEVGGELRLRGSIDLNEVGKPFLHPKTAKVIIPTGRRDQQ